MTKNAQIVPVVLSGGMGTRLWPMSRSHYPKQFLPLGGGEQSLIQQTVQRVQDTTRFASPAIICNYEHRFLAREHMAALGLNDMPIYLEPCSRNTAAAIGLAAFHALESHGDEALLLVLPSDHLVRQTGAFLNAMDKAAHVAAQGYLVTFGIETAHPETGYGYIKAGAQVVDTDGVSVDAFVEKPDLETAKTYVEDDAYYWNSGMFMFSAKVLLEELMLHQAEVAAVVQKVFQHKQKDGNFRVLEEAIFSKAPNISIDYAVMECTERAAVVPVECGWSDAGSWDALWREQDEKDAQGNVCQGESYLVESDNCYVMSEDAPAVATLGVSNLIIISTKDCVLVADKHRAQDVKALVEHVRAERPELITNHRKVFRPWGAYDSIDFGERHQVKRITVKPGASLSLQMHYHRAEHWVVVTGSAQVTCGEEERMVTENESIYIPCGTKHRLRNLGKIPLELIEVQSGAYLGEDDIVRFEDRYGRVSDKAVQ